MSEPAQYLSREALRLPPNERAAPVEQLSASLDKPDPLMDALWLKEAESRMAAIAPASWMLSTLKRCSTTWTAALEAEVPAPGAPGIGGRDPLLQSPAGCVGRCISE